MNGSVRVRIEPSSGLTEIGTLAKTVKDEEYLSHDGSCILKLQFESELHFGPAYYRAAIYRSDGRLVRDFKERRFLSCTVYSRYLSGLENPWNPTSLRLALPELLSRAYSNPPGTKLARLNILDLSRDSSEFMWDSESVTTHIMWSRDGELYLYRDAFRIYSISGDEMRLTMLTESRNCYCFVLENRFVCVIERWGSIKILDGTSGKLLVTDDLSQGRYTVRLAKLDEKRNCVLVLLKQDYGRDEDGICYSVRLQLGRIDIYTFQHRYELMKWWYGKPL